MTTILCIRTPDKLVMIGDGQVSTQSTIMKAHAHKIRRIANGRVICGFAGTTADAFALLERLEVKLEKFPTQLARACVELAKDWRTDKYLRQLQAMMIVADIDETFLLTGNGDVVSPDEGITAIGSGGHFALAAAQALTEYEKDAQTIAQKAMQIAANICVFTNNNFITETLDIQTQDAQNTNKI